MQEWAEITHSLTWDYCSQERLKLAVTTTVHDILKCFLYVFHWPDRIEREPLQDDVIFLRRKAFVSALVWFDGDKFTHHCRVMRTWSVGVYDIHCPPSQKILMNYWIFWARWRVYGRCSKSDRTHDVRGWLVPSVFYFKKCECVIRGQSLTPYWRKEIIFITEMLQCFI